jgi:hypothetical protein
MIALGLELIEIQIGTRHYLRMHFVVFGTGFLNLGPEPGVLSESPEVKGG